MSTTVELGEEFLEHFGVKGMRWGHRKERTSRGERRIAKLEVKEERRRSERSPTGVKVVDTIGPSKHTKTKIKAVGGEDIPATEDAIRVAATRQKMKRSGVHALTNKELEEMARRLNLEQQVNSLEAKRPKTAGQKFIEDFIEGAAQGQKKRKQTA